MSATFCPCAPIKEDTAKVGTWNWACIGQMEVELLRLRVGHGDMCKPGSEKMTTRITVVITIKIKWLCLNRTHENKKVLES